MNVFLISMSAGTFVFLVISIIQDLIFGDRGKSGQLSNHYSLLRGNDSSNKKKSKKFKSYKNAGSSIKRYYIYVLPVCLAIFLFVFMAFKSLFIALLLSFFGLVFPRVMYNNTLKKRSLLMQSQFKDALNSLMASLKAGLSINSALIKCTEDLERVYSHTQDKPILDEFKKIRNDLSVGLPVEQALIGFRERVKIEDVDDFVNSVIVVRQKGGNLVDVMENVVEMITDKISMKKDIEILTSGKRMESRIITFIPIFIVTVLSIIAPNYMKPLYSSLVGKILIVLGFILLATNYFVGRKITDIDI